MSGSCFDRRKGRQKTLQSLAIISTPAVSCTAAHRPGEFAKYDDRCLQEIKGKEHENRAGQGQAAVNDEFGGGAAAVSTSAPTPTFCDGSTLTSPIERNAPFPSS